MSLGLWLHCSFFLVFFWFTLCFWTTWTARRKSYGVSIALTIFYWITISLAATPDMNMECWEQWASATRVLSKYWQQKHSSLQFLVYLLGLLALNWPPCPSQGSFLAMLTLNRYHKFVSSSVASLLCNNNKLASFLLHQDVRLSESAVLTAAVFGVSMALVGNIAPISRALSRTLRDSLDVYHHVVGSVSVRVMKLAEWVAPLFVSAQL